MQRRFAACLAEMSEGPGWRTPMQRNCGFMECRRLLHACREVDERANGGIEVSIKAN